MLCLADSLYRSVPLSRPNRRFKTCDRSGGRPWACAGWCLCSVAFLQLDDATTAAAGRAKSRLDASPLFLKTQGGVLPGRSLASAGSPCLGLLVEVGGHSPGARWQLKVLFKERGARRILGKPALAAPCSNPGPRRNRLGTAAVPDSFRMSAR